MADSPSLDAFSNQRVSQAQSIFGAQFTYDLHPLIYEQITTGTGATITHDATERNAVMAFAATTTGGETSMQSWKTLRYRPGKSQLIKVTFNFKSAVANVVKFAGYTDSTNGIEFQNDGTNNQFVILSGTSNGNQTVIQSAWNLDKLDGTGTSGITLDITQQQIAILDFQALYVGRVRVGFDVGGVIIYVHEFLHANTTTHPYIQSANLPIKVGMRCTGTVTTTMVFNCCSVESEGGDRITDAYKFTSEATVTAASGAQTHLMSLRPKTTFNSIENRYSFALVDISILVTGTNPVKWELCIGQALTTPSYSDVNATYSATEVDSAGTLSGTPAIVIDSGYINASNQSDGQIDILTLSNYPITLNSAGANRDLGTLTLLVTGIGGTSALRGSMSHKEVR